MNGRSRPKAASQPAPYESTPRLAQNRGRPAMTFRGFRRDLEPHHRLSRFLKLPEELQLEADEHFAYQLSCRRRLELYELAMDEGWDFPERVKVSAAEEPRRVSKSRCDRKRDDVFDKIPPPVYFAALTGQWPKAGKVHCPSPLHADANASCEVYDEPGGGFNCWSCPAGGSVIDLGSLLTGIEPRGDGYLRLRKWIAQRLLEAGVT